MVKQDYERALTTAKSEYGKLLKERERTDARLIELRDVILSLSKMCEGEASEVTLPPKDQFIADPRLQKLNIFGLTDAVRIVLQSAIGAVTAKHIRDRLLVFNYDMKKYSNPMAALHGVIVRLLQAGEVVVVQRDGYTAYRWVGPKTPPNYHDAVLEAADKVRK